MNFNSQSFSFSGNPLCVDVSALAVQGGGCVSLLPQLQLAWLQRAFPLSTSIPGQPGLGQRRTLPCLLSQLWCRSSQQELHFSPLLKELSHSVQALSFVHIQAECPPDASK